MGFIYRWGVFRIFSGVLLVRSSVIVYLWAECTKYYPQGTGWTDIHTHFVLINFGVVQRGTFNTPLKY